MNTVLSKKDLWGIYRKAWGDKEFKDRLIKNPKECLSNIFGKDFKDFAIQIEDQSDEQILYLNIPAKPNFDSVELGEDILDSVAGGKGNDLMSKLGNYFFT